MIGWLLLALLGRSDFPWGERIDLGEAAADLVKSAIDEAKSKKNPLAGLIFKVVFSPLKIQALGVVTALIKIGKREHLCGMLNLGLNPAATASPPLSSQSPPAAPAS